MYAARTLGHIPRHMNQMSLNNNNNIIVRLHVPDFNVDSMFHWLFCLFYACITRDIAYYLMHDAFNNQTMMILGTYVI